MLMHDPRVSDHSKVSQQHSGPQVGPWHVMLEAHTQVHPWGDWCGSQTQQMRMLPFLHNSQSPGLRRALRVLGSPMPTDTTISAATQLPCLTTKRTS